MMLSSLVIMESDLLLIHPFFYFQTDDNKLTGTIPTEIGKMTYLSSLSLRECECDIDVFDPSFLKIALSLLMLIMIFYYQPHPIFPH